MHTQLPTVNQNFPSPTIENETLFCLEKETHNSRPLPKGNRANPCLVVLAGLATSTDLRLLGEQHSVNVGENTTGGDGDISEQSVQFLIVLDGQGNVTGDDTALLVVTSGVTSQLQDFSTQVLQHGRQVDGGTGTHTGCVLALTQVTADTTDGELQSSLARTGGLSLLVSTSSLTLSYLVVGGSVNANNRNGTMED